MNPLEAAKILSTALKLTESQTKKEFENVREEAKLRSDELRKELKTLEHSFDLVEGEQGPAGPMGPSGERGYIGQKGEKGDQGIHGERGLQGEKGEKGDQGILRIPGDIGPKGDTGVEGDQGIQGEKGEKGDQGVQGIRGEKGIQGDKGDRGIQGDKGVQGISGKDGTDGLPGDNGLNGDVGPKGERGSQGIQGQKGDQGLTGDKGDKGNPGTDINVAPFQQKFEELSKNIDTRISKLAYGVAIGGHSAGSGEVNLRSLDDVDYNSVSAPTDGHALIYNGTLGKWQANTAGGGSFLTNTFTTTVSTRTLIPTSNITFNLGSTTKRYKDIFLANSTIYLGAAQISASGSKVLFNNEAAVSNSYLQATFATSASVTTQINNLVDSAPGALNTLNELAAALNDDAEFSSTITNSLAAKATAASLTSTNTAIRLLVSDRLQVANASTLYATKSNPTTSGLLAHTGRATISTNLAVSGNTTISGLIANGAIGTSNYVLRTNGSTTFWAPGGGSTTQYIEVVNANALYTTKAYAAANSYVKNILANTNLAITNVKTGLTGTNTAIRALVSDRLQVANAAAIYATKSNPTTSGLLAHTGRATISTNLAVSGNTTISGLIANGAIGTSNYVLRTNGTSAFWAPGGGSTDKYIEVANANALYATKISPTTSGLLAHTGRATISTNLAVSGNTSINKLTVTSLLASSGNTTLGNGVADITTITGTASVSKNLTVSGNTSITGWVEASELVATNGLVVNKTTISGNFTIASGFNAMSVGPVTISDGISVTVSNGQRWVVL